MKFSKLLQSLLFGMGLMQMGIVEEGAGGAGDEGAEGGEGGEGGEGDEGGEGGDGKKPDEKPPTKPKISDADAKLLKENMKRKEDLQKANKELKAAQDRLKEFDGLDPTELRALVADKKAAEENQLTAKGEWDKLKERMATEHTNATKALKDQITALSEQLNGANGTIDELTVGQTFNQSPFLKETLYTPSKARKLWGGHFEREDGEIVGYDKPRGATGREKLVDQFGNALPFEAAMQKIAEADPDYESFMRSKVKTGADSHSKTKVAARKEAVPEAGLDKIAAGLKGLKLL